MWICVKELPRLRRKYPPVLYSVLCSGVFRTDTKFCPYSLLVTFLKHEYSFRAVRITQNEKYAMANIRVYIMKNHKAGTQRSHVITSYGFHICV